MSIHDEQKRAARHCRGVPADPRVGEFNREYTPEEDEFLVALERYKGRTGRHFPTVTDLLAVLKSLGYTKPPAASTPDAGATLNAEERADATDLRGV